MHNLIRSGPLGLDGLGVQRCRRGPLVRLRRRAGRGRVFPPVRLQAADPRGARDAVQRPGAGRCQAKSIRSVSAMPPPPLRHCLIPLRGCTEYILILHVKWHSSFRSIQVCQSVLAAWQIQERKAKNESQEAHLEPCLRRDPQGRVPNYSSIFISPLRVVRFINLPCVLGTVPHEPEQPGIANPVADGLALGHVRPQRFSGRGAHAAGEQNLRRSSAAVVSPAGESKHGF